MFLVRIIVLCLVALTSLGFRSPKKCELASINLIDRSGMTEIIREKKRLAQFEKIEFLAPQPYQKVLRVFLKDKMERTPSIVTSYYPSGELKQYLEGIDNRASGLYREWYPNGVTKIEGEVISGIVDLHVEAEKSWLFDGISRAYDERGALQAEIWYQKGSLEGESRYYHKNGALWKIAPYQKNLLHGEHLTFNEQGDLIEKIPYFEGAEEGVALSYYKKDSMKNYDFFEKGHLIESRSYHPNGEMVASIAKGNGFRALFENGTLSELHEYKNGRAEGAVEIYDSLSRKISSYSVKEGEKHGEEIQFFPETGKPELLLTWRSGILQGIVKTWYENGNLESQKEISQNKKNGMVFAWYPSGSLMLVEEYENDRLIRGEYFRPGEKAAASKVEKGKGIATLFDADGHLLRKVRYQDGKPSDI